MLLFVQCIEVSGQDSSLFVGGPEAMTSPASEGMSSWRVLWPRNSGLTNPQVRANLGKY